ncbi:hypothetical protein OUZ56_026557 [Daphnia magna]|uniref:Uncharacterized protein n=1 Tax=Daphnia magna TaxID=35525 RepID=A0ABQ9ZM78_9CRUS|nr:hypothetical protein OUZ56_026557 [Daphnia magna]
MGTGNVCERRATDTMRPPWFYRDCEENLLGDNSAIIIQWRGMAASPSATTRWQGEGTIMNESLSRATFHNPARMLLHLTPRFDWYLAHIYPPDLMRLRGRCCKAGSTYANIDRENFELALRNLKASPRWPSKSPTLSLCLYIIDRVSYIAECSNIFKLPYFLLMFANVQVQYVGSNLLVVCYSAHIGHYKEKEERVPTYLEKQEALTVSPCPTILTALLTNCFINAGRLKGTKPIWEGVKGVLQMLCGYSLFAYG